MLRHFFCCFFLFLGYFGYLSVVISWSMILTHLDDAFLLVVLLVGLSFLFSPFPFFAWDSFCTNHPLFLSPPNKLLGNRRIKSFLLLYQRNQQAGWLAAFGLKVEGMGVPEVGQGAWWYLAWVDIPYRSGRSPWTLGTVRGQKHGGGCCRPSVPPPLGRTRPQRVPTASRSTSQKPKLDSEHMNEVSPTHLLTYLHPFEVDPFINLSISLNLVLILCTSLLFILYPPLQHLHHFTNYKLTSLAH